MRKNKIKSVYVWTWLADFGNGPELCHFAEATKKLLINQGKPTPGAKRVRVLMGVLK